MFSSDSDGPAQAVYLYGWTATDQPAVPDPDHRGPLGSRLAVVNAKFDTGIPPSADQYEVILVDR